MDYNVDSYSCTNVLIVITIIVVIIIIAIIIVTRQVTRATQ